MNRIVFQEKGRRVTAEEHKQVMLNILKYVDGICRKNDIKYSLIGGSLIGAIRHKGFIPWDDDLDIILDYHNYNKFINVFKEQKLKKYKMLIPGETIGYPLPFIKIIDTDTYLEESGLSHLEDDYGVFVDVFCYNNVPDNRRECKKYYRKYAFLMRCLTKLKIDYHEAPMYRQVVRFLKNIYISVFGYEKNLKKILKLFESNTGLKSLYVMSNSPGYGFEKELQLEKDIKKYTNTVFEGIRVMIFENYDNILKTTFGNYMQMPPESERVPKHNLNIWWKVGSEEEAARVSLMVNKRKKKKEKR